MKHFSKTELAQLLENGKLDNHGKDHVPIARFFLNGIDGTLLVTEIREETMMAYGLCDLSNDVCKVTHFHLNTFTELAERQGYSIKRDEKFKGQYPLSVYAKGANRRRTVALMQDALKKSEVA